MADLKTSDITDQNSKNSNLISENKNNFPNEISVGKFFSFPNGLSFTIKSIKINGFVVKEQISRILRPKDKLEIVSDNNNFYQIFNKAGLVFEGGEYFPPQNRDDFKANVISFTLPKEESETLVPEGPVWLTLGGSYGNIPIQTKFTFLQTTNNTEDEAKKAQSVAEEALRQRDSITAGLATTRAGVRLKADEALATGNLEFFNKYVGVMASSGDTEGLKILLGKTSDQTFQVLLEKSIKISQNVSLSRTEQKVGNRVVLNKKVGSQVSSATQTGIEIDDSDDTTEVNVGEVSGDANISGEVNVTGALAGSSQVKTQGEVEVSASTKQILGQEVTGGSEISVSANRQSSGNVGLEVNEKLKTQAGISTEQEIEETNTTSASINTQTASKQTLSGTENKISTNASLNKTGNVSLDLKQNAPNNSQVSGNINLGVEAENNLQGVKQTTDIKKNTESKIGGEINQSDHIKDSKAIKQENEQSTNYKLNYTEQDEEDKQNENVKPNDDLTKSKAEESSETNDGVSKANLQVTQSAGAKALKESLDRNSKAAELRLGLSRSGGLREKIKANRPANQAGVLGKRNEKAKSNAGSLPSANLTNGDNLLGQRSLPRQDQKSERLADEKVNPDKLSSTNEPENEQESQNQIPKNQVDDLETKDTDTKKDNKPEIEEDLEQPEQPNLPNLPQQVKPKVSGIEKLEIEKAALVISTALNVFLLDAALWVWTASFISLGLLLIPAAIAADLLPIIKKYLIGKFARVLPLPGFIDKNLDMVIKEVKFSGAVKLNILLLNLAALLWVCGAFLAIAYVGCNDPVGKEADYRLSYMGLAGYSDVCRSLESAAGAFGVNAPTGQLITPAGLLSTASWTEAIKQTAAAYAPVDSCILRVVVEKESGGQADVIGCDCAYNGNAAACLNQPKKYYSGYKFNWDQCSYGIGITQWTIYQKRYATSATDFRRWRDVNTPSRTPFGSNFYTVDDFLNPQTSLNLTAEKFQRDLRSNGNDVRAAFAAYVGQSSSQSRFVEERMRLYEMCKANGG